MTVIDNKIAFKLFQNLGEERDDFIDISIQESQKVGDGMGAYLAYKVITRTNIPIFKKKTMCVMRRFSDFLGLHDKLIEKYQRTGRIIPPAPEKSVIGNTFLFGDKIFEFRL